MTVNIPYSVIIKKILLIDLNEIEFFINPIRRKKYE